MFDVPEKQAYTVRTVRFYRSGIPGTIVYDPMIISPGRVTSRAVGSREVKYRVGPATGTGTRPRGVKSSQVKSITVVVGLRDRVATLSSSQVK